MITLKQVHTEEQTTGRNIPVVYFYFDLKFLFFFILRFNFPFYINTHTNGVVL